MKNCISLVALASCAITSPAFAGQATEPFVGPKVGIDVSYDSNIASRILPGNTVRTSEAAGGLAVRGFFGYDTAIGNSMIMGVEAGIGAGGRESTMPFTGGSYSLSPRKSYDLTGRVGFVAAPGLLLYGRGGIRWLRTQRETISVIPAQAIAERNQTNSGVTYGVGAEYALSPKLSLRGEFNRTRFDRDLKQNKVSIGVAYHF